MIRFQTLQSGAICALIFSSFISWSALTPLGFISPSDLVLACSVLLLGFAALRNALPLPQPKAVSLWLAIGCFLCVALSTLVLRHDLPPSPVIKYAVLLLGLPLMLWFARAGGTGISARYCLHVIGNCGAIFVAWLTLSLLLGQGVEGRGPVSIFGAPIYKNQLGHYLALIATAQFGLWALTGRSFRLVLFAVALGLSLALDVRGPILAALAASTFLALRLFGQDKAHLRRLSTLPVLGVIFVAILLASGHFSAQFSRFFETALPEGAEISSTASRNLLWHYTLEQIPKALWFGQGHGGFIYAEGTGWMANLAQPHNNILQITIEGGIIGLAGFLLLLWSCLRPRPEQKGPEEGALIVLRAIALTYLTTTLVDIIWVRGTGHLFWLIAFILATTPEARPTSAP